MLWNEVVYLHQNYNEEDKAIKTMISHSPSCFKHELFLQVIQKVNNSSIFYEAIDFYLEEEPRLLNELLRTLTAKLDLSKVVNQVSVQDATVNHLAKKSWVSSNHR